MTPTADFFETIRNRARRDKAFRKALFSEALNAFFSDDEPTGRALLKDYIHATIGFESLAASLGKSPKSLHRMLGPNGNPNTANFFAILRVLREDAGVRIAIRAA